MARKRVRLLENLEIENIADKGRCVAKTEDGKVVFVEKTAIGDKLDVTVFKKRKGIYEARPLKFHKYSEDRQDPFCEHFGRCGGCKWQHVNYEAQLKYKHSIVTNAMQRIGKLDTSKLLPIIGAEETTFYRNKMEFTFSNKKWLEKEELDSGITNLEDVLGFHPQGAYDKIIDLKKCFLQPDPSNDLRNSIRKIAHDQGHEFWDARFHKGFLRQVLIRITNLKQIMVVMSVSRDDQEEITRLLTAIKDKHPEINSLMYCINTKLNDFMFDLDMIPFSGPTQIEEQLGHVKFKIGPKSFFQTNTNQAKLLYDLVVEFAELKGVENVYDLYTGLGSIAQYIAQDCKQVVGIEEVKEAIDDAKINAEMNEIENCVFYAGDVKDILSPEFAAKHGAADLVITDPPRAGMHPKVVSLLLELAAPRMVYVSCNPATQARDLDLLKEKYEVVKIQPVDMFPHTHHIESVALLELK